MAFFAVLHLNQVQNGNWIFVAVDFCEGTLNCVTSLQSGLGFHKEENSDDQGEFEKMGTDRG